MRNPIILGLVGEKGSGKETVAKIMQKILDTKEASHTSPRLRGTGPFVRRKTVHIKFSDLLKETLDLWSIPSSRTNLQDLAIIMDQHFGDGTLANALFQRIQKLDAEVVILDGIRWDADIVLINKFKKHYLIYVTAALKTRFERISRRIEKVGEGRDFEQFMKEERKPNEVNISRLGEKADYKIENNKGKITLKKSIDAIINELKI